MNFHFEKWAVVTGRRATVPPDPAPAQAAARARDSAATLKRDQVLDNTGYGSASERSDKSLS